MTVGNFRGSLISQNATFDLQTKVRAKLENAYTTKYYYFIERTSFAPHGPKSKFTIDSYSYIILYFAGIQFDNEKGPNPFAKRKR